MTAHLITSSSPIVGKYAKSMCDKPCEIYRNIPTDADLQDFDMRSLTSCKKCLARELDKYVYVGRTRKDKSDEQQNES